LNATSHKQTEVTVLSQEFPPTINGTTLKWHTSKKKTSLYKSKSKQALYKILWDIEREFFCSFLLKDNKDPYKQPKINCGKEKKSFFPSMPKFFLY